MKQRIASTVAALGVILAPAVAVACPYCATRSGGGLGMSLAIGAFILLPFGVSGVVYSILRRDSE